MEKPLFAFFPDAAPGNFDLSESYYYLLRLKSRKRKGK
jgi:hypothetical protein